MSARNAFLIAFLFVLPACQVFPDPIVSPYFQSLPGSKQRHRIAYVGLDGSGHFNCDGTDDQIEINQALEFVARNGEFGTVHLKGPHTYRISGTVLLPSDIILQGTGMRS